MSNKSIDEQESEIRSHWDEGEVGAPELLHVGCVFIPAYVIGNIAELVFPVAVHIVVDIPGEEHAYTKPAADDVHQPVFVLHATRHKTPRCSPHP